MDMRAHKKLLLLLLAILFLVTGCSGLIRKPASTTQPIQIQTISPVVSTENVSVECNVAPEPQPCDYLVGAGDILSVAVLGLPSISLQEGTSSQNSNQSKGSRVDSDGTIQLQFIGSVKVAGMTLRQIRDRLQAAYSKYIKNPSIVVEIVEYKSQPLYLLGQFKKASTYYMDRPLNLLQGVALGQGMESTANLRGARLLRKNKIVPVDIYALFHDGDQRQNVWLMPGDAIFIPDNSMQNVFVFGAVKNPGPIEMKNGKLFLHQAVAAAGGLGDITYDSNIRIIRSVSPTRGELIVVDLDKTLKGDAQPFPLVDGDIVYVPKSIVGNWNQAINELLPSLNLIGAVLNPFVQLKFLSQ